MTLKISLFEKCFKDWSTFGSTKNRPEEYGVHFSYKEYNTLQRSTGADCLLIHALEELSLVPNKSNSSLLASTLW